MQKRQNAASVRGFFQSTITLEVEKILPYNFRILCTKYVFFKKFKIFVFEKNCFKFSVLFSSEVKFATILLNPQKTSFKKK